MPCNTLRMNCATYLLAVRAVTWEVSRIASSQLVSRSIPELEVPIGGEEEEHEGGEKGPEEERDRVADAALLSQAGHHVHRHDRVAVDLQAQLACIYIQPDMAPLGCSLHVAPTTNAS